MWGCMETCLWYEYNEKLKLAQCVAREWDIAGTQSMGYNEKINIIIKATMHVTDSMLSAEHGGSECVLEACYWKDVNRIRS